MGAKSEAIREREALRLLNYGFRNFVSMQLFKKGDVLLQLSVWKGTEGQVELAAGETGIVTVPITLQADVIWKAQAPEKLFAPIERGQTIGEVVITTKDKVFKSVPLVANQEIPRAGFFKQAMHTAALIAVDHGKVLILVVVLLGGAVGSIWYLRHRKPKRRRSGVGARK
jgi:D-alanyl-D-alanine carboxypeptidase (penicillin-binding protein 5/6)